MEPIQNVSKAMHSLDGNDEYVVINMTRELYNQMARQLPNQIHKSSPMQKIQASQASNFSHSFTKMSQHFK